MTRIVSPASKPGRPAKLAAVLALSAILVLGPLVETASAEQQAGQDNTSVKNRNKSNRDLRQNQERSSGSNNGSWSKYWNGQRARPLGNPP